jgi:serine/threonine protein kinase
MGGMGAVYQAWDSELGVAVAIKVVLPASPTIRRPPRKSNGDSNASCCCAPGYTQERRTHSRSRRDRRHQVHHDVVRRGIRSLFDPEEGRPASSRTCTENRAGHRFRSRGSHVEGVVHRDLKPANIMIEGDDALIMDFGIARSTGRQ